MKKKIFYWSPSISKNIATNKAVINSAYAINRYSKRYKASILNACGEFDEFKDEIEKREIEIINLRKKSFINLLPKLGKIKSRLSYLIILITSFKLLKNKIKKDKPDFLIIHLITSLPLFLLLFYKFETKFILRISGLPKLNFFRKFLWKNTLDKLHLITCPTKLTKDLLVELNFVDKKIIKILEDPIIEVKKINNIKKITLEDNYKKKYILAAGRLTKQKNFLFLLKTYNKFLNKKNYNLIIAGEGEMHLQIKNYINQHNLNKNVFLIGHKKNIYPYFKNAACYIMSSKWEDPGFTLIESLFLKTPVISSDCPNGPKEIIIDHKNGFKFKNNQEESLAKSFIEFENSSKYKIDEMIKNGLKTSRKFTIFNHYKTLINILE